MTVSGLYPQDAQVCGRRLMHRDELDRSLDRDPFAYANQTGRNRLEARFQAYVSTLPRNTMGAIDPALLVPRACPLCGSWESAQRFVKYDFPIHRCARCGFSFANPMLNAALTAVLETGDLAADHLAFITQDVYKRCAALRFEYELQHALAYHHGTPKTLLEIGSSIGTGLEVAKAYGLQPIGVEPSPVAAQLAQAAGHEVIVDIFQASHFPVQRFDLIMSMDVLEHVPDPVDFLAQARSILSPDGVLLLQVPNAGALISLLEGKANQIYNGLIHLNYFDGPSLDATAQKAGLRPLHTTTILSELGKLARWPEAEVRLALHHAHPTIAADYRLHQDWINDHGLGYKVLGLYGYET
jgi:SAM-dependent methyltransferase